VRKKILFLCTHNSCRSQMAEALVNHDLGDHWQAFSAGTTPAHPHPLALKVLAELGIDHSAATSKHLDTFLDHGIDLAITLCGNAAKNCPVYIGAKRTVHIGFDDPAAAEGDEDQVLPFFRRVRDEIRSKIEEYLNNYDENTAPPLKLQL
jgi:arsenate reductase (thioredoxin)